MMGEPVRGFGAGTAQPGKVLVIVSSARALQLANGKTPETGHFLIELTQPLQALIKAGYQLEFASPTGDGAHIDPLSNSRLWFVHTLSPGKQYQEALGTLDWLKANTNYSRPLRIDQLGGGQLQGYKALVFPGGHAPMVDLWNNPSLGLVLRHFHDAGKPIGAICHGPIALLSTMAVKAPQAQHYPAPEPAGTGGYGDVADSFPFRGYRMCCYSDAEEMANEAMWRDKLMFKAEHELRRYGGRMEEGWPMVPHVVTDKELVTGQGPTSADKFGKKLVQRIREFDTRGSLRV